MLYLLVVSVSLPVSVSLCHCQSPSLFSLSNYPSNSVAYSNIINTNSNKTLKWIPFIPDPFFFSLGSGFVFILKVWIRNPFVFNIVILRSRILKVHSRIRLFCWVKSEPGPVLFSRVGSGYGSGKSPTGYNCSIPERDLNTELHLHVVDFLETSNIEVDQHDSRPV